MSEDKCLDIMMSFLFRVVSTNSISHIKIQMPLPLTLLLPLLLIIFPIRFSASQEPSSPREPGVVKPVNLQRNSSVDSAGKSKSIFLSWHALDCHFNLFLLMISSSTTFYGPNTDAVMYYTVILLLHLFTVICSTSRHNVSGYSVDTTSLKDRCCIVEHYYHDPTYLLSQQTHYTTTPPLCH